MIALFTSTVPAVPHPEYVPLTPSLLARAAKPRHDPWRRSKRHQAGTAPEIGGITMPGPWAGSVVDRTPREGEEARAS